MFTVVYTVMGIVWVCMESLCLIFTTQQVLVRIQVLGLCVSVCLLLNISLYTRLFVPQTIVTFPAAGEGRKF